MCNNRLVFVMISQVFSLINKEKDITYKLFELYNLTFFGERVRIIT